MTNVIDIDEATLRRKNNAKWATYGDTVIPAWVAEMDFEVAPPIQAAIRKVVEDEDYGYAVRNGGLAERLVSEAFARRMVGRFNWNAEAKLAIPVSDCVQATFACVTAFSDPGDGVVLQLPAYPPFHMAVNDTGRRIVPSPMRPTRERYTFDLEALRASLDPGTRILVICNPHNPTGRVFDRAELLALAELAVEREMVILADEIHADLLFDGRRHIPVASLGAELAPRTLTNTSATKSFNIPGLRCGVMHFGEEALMGRFLARVPARVLGEPGILGIVATVAAWDEGQPWLDSLMVRLHAARAHLVERLGAELPRMRFIPPEATYLAWLDFGALDLPGSAFRCLLRGGVALSAGETFEAGFEHFARLNFATSPILLESIIDRIVAVGRSAR